MYISQPLSPPPIPTVKPTARFGQKYSLSDIPELSPLVRTIPRKPVSLDFLKALNQAVLSLPEYIQKHLSLHEVDIVATPWVVSAFPALRNASTPPGYDTSSSWEDCPAVYSQSTIALAEFTRHPLVSQLPKWLSPLTKTLLSKPLAPQSQHDNIPRMLRHEVGHAIDDTFGLLSCRPPFTTALQNDLKACSEHVQKRLQYFIQGSTPQETTRQGCLEAFAESVASLYGGGCVKAKEFQKAFPNCVDYAYRVIKSVMSLQAPRFSGKPDRLKRSA